MQRKLRYGMVGGGRGAFIGAVHRMAARLDGGMDLVSGCFSADAEKSRLSGEDLYIDPTRVYTSYQEMAEKEAALPAEQRIDFVSIVTPNHLHVPIATTFLEHGFHVVCDKPLSSTLAEGQALAAVIKRTGKIFALTHNYTGYPMVKEARELVHRGELGTILKIVAEYPQGWLMDRLETEGQKQAAWRTDPAQAGASCCIGDIGTHAENLGHYITGLEIEKLCADFTTFIPGRLLEDDGNLLVHYRGGARGVLYASQISCGEENNLTIRVYGTLGALEWKQEHPNELRVQYKQKPAQILRRGNAYLSAQAAKFTRLPCGHPEAFIEAFANLYTEVGRSISDRLGGVEAGQTYDFPTIEAGLAGMAFIEASVASARNGGTWVSL